MDKRFSWLWPAVILVSVVAVIYSFSIQSSSQLRPVIVFWFFLVCPGMAYVQLLGLKNPLFQWTIAIALSLALDTIVATAMLYAGLWDPRRGLIALVWLSLIGAGLQTAQLLGRPIIRQVAARRGSGSLNRQALVGRVLRWFQAVVAGLALLCLFALVWFRTEGVRAGPLTGFLNDRTSEKTPAIPSNLRPETSSPTSSAQEEVTPVFLLTPPEGVICAQNCSLIFRWNYAMPLSADQRFTVYLFAGNRENPIPLGVATQPDADENYRLVLAGNALSDIPRGDYLWQVILERISTGENLVYSPPRLISFPGNTQQLFMTSMVNGATVRTITSSSFEELTTVLGLVLIVFLLVLLVLKELVRVLETPEAKIWMQASDIVIVPLFLAFGLLILIRLLHL